MRVPAGSVLARLFALVSLFFVMSGCGLPDTQTGDDSFFVLPYPIGESYTLIQGNDGQWGHQDATRYAFDFLMDVGTPIVAARAGRVVAVEERYEDGNHTPGQENYIFIQHDDSTYSRYYHLTKDGVLVETGEQVEQGQKIGLSGNTGASAGPHLHFDVTTGCPEWGCQTVEIEFANASENPLREETAYEALAPRRLLPDGRPQ